MYARGGSTGYFGGDMTKLVDDIQELRQVMWLRATLAPARCRCEDNNNNNNNNNNTILYSTVY